MAVLAYVDDTYLVVTSPSHAENNRMMEVLHREIMIWADENRVIFEPSKYAVMHFKQPGITGDAYGELPEIPGLDDKAKQLKTQLRILGIVVDHKLKWSAHVALVAFSILHYWTLC